MTENGCLHREHQIGDMDLKLTSIPVRLVCAVTAYYKFKTTLNGVFMVAFPLYLLLLTHHLLYIPLTSSYADLISVHSEK